MPPVRCGRGHHGPEFWLVARGLAACSRGERGTRPGPRCSWGLPTRHGGAWFGGEWAAASGALVLPGERSLERPGLPHPASPLWGRVQPCPAPWHSLGTDPWRGSREPSLPPGTPVGQRTPPSLGPHAPDPVVHLGVGWDTMALPLPPGGQDRSAPLPGLLPTWPRNTPALRQKRLFPNDNEATAGWHRDCCIPSQSLGGWGLPPTAPGSWGSCLLPVLRLLQLPPGWSLALPGQLLLHSLPGRLGGRPPSLTLHSLCAGWAVLAIPRARACPLSPVAPLARAGVAIPGAGGPAHCC